MLKKSNHFFHGRATHKDTPKRKVRYSARKFPRKTFTIKIQFKLYYFGYGCRETMILQMSY